MSSGVAMTPNAGSGYLLTARELAARDWPEPSAHVEGLITAGEVGLFIGQQKRGKSTLARQLAVDVANGTRFLDSIPTTKGTVLYIDFENKPAQIRRSLLDVVGEQALPDNLFIQSYDQIVHRDIGLGKKHLSKLKVLVGEVRPALLILDPLRLALGTETSLTDDKNLVTLVESAQELVTLSEGMSVLIVHHLKKAQDFAYGLREDPMRWIEQVYGGQALLGHVEFILGLDEESDGYAFGSIQRSQAARTLTLTKHPDQLRFLLADPLQRALKAFTDAERRLWDQLPNEFTYGAGQALASSKGLLDSVIRKAKSAELLRSATRGQYVKTNGAKALGNEGVIDIIRHS
jgi:hypothetical protein